MTKACWLLFIVLLVHAHLADAHGGAYHRPLSEFRDFEPEWVGYAMFFVLLLFGTETFRKAFRAGAPVAGVTYVSVTGLLSIVAVTPSDGLLHNICAVVAMLLMYIYFGALLYGNDCFGVWTAHVAAPLMILAATKAESYGIWQKGMILYFLTGVVIQFHFLPKRTGIHSLAGFLQQLQHGRFPHPYWLRDLIEGIEWSRKSQRSSETRFPILDWCATIVRTRLLACPPNTDPP